MKLVRLSLVVVALFAVCGRCAVGQEAVAKIGDFSGQVQIQHGDKVIVPTKAGPIVRNGTIYNNDTVRTAKGQARVVFDDGTYVDMDEGTALQITVSRMAPTAEAEGKLERRIKVVLGRIYSMVKPNPAIGATRFELPDGIAAVRGTTVRVDVTPDGNWEFYLDEGEGTLKQEKIKSTMELKDKCGIGCEKKGDNSYEFANLGEKCVDIWLPPSPVTLEDGTVEMRETIIRDFCPGDELNITLSADGRYSITPVKGSVTVTNPAPKEAAPWAGIPPGEAVPPPMVGGGGGGGGGGGAAEEKKEEAPAHPGH